MTSLGAAPQEDEITRLFEASPDRPVRTSAASVSAFLLGLVAILTAPFTQARGLALLAGGMALVVVVVGMAATSRSHVAGRALVAAGLFLALAALVVIGMGYAGFDTTFGDGLVPTLTSWLETLRSTFRLP
ncbi:hypothetical protein ncot_11240 [Nocardioides sp. JQ2195]|uniref:hypothetical protein n=1 Tax=Nocardioides sp. JQ2195 TaxID=2592334 RepID=UPI00143E593F|nr:hypothetical protein [Nocardioides sp. JQ2195]QIX27105.1 hypothetical protein ncot_11240 [Nocardioides sp. JQ2195]